MTVEVHPVEALLDALRAGPATLIDLSERTGYYPGPHLGLIIRARSQGHRISARRVDGVTTFELEEPSEQEHTA